MGNFFLQARSISASVRRRRPRTGLITTVPPRSPTSMGMPGTIPNRLAMLAGMGAVTLPPPLLGLRNRGHKAPPSCMYRIYTISPSVKVQYNALVFRKL